MALLLFRLALVTCLTTQSLGVGAFAAAAPPAIAALEQGEAEDEGQVVVTIPGYPTYSSHAPVLYEPPPVGPHRFLSSKRVGDEWTFRSPSAGLAWLSFHYGGMVVVPGSLAAAAQAFGNSLDFGLDLSNYELQEGDLAAVASPGLRGLKLCNHLRSTERADLDVFLGEGALSSVSGSLTELHLCLHEVDDALLASRLVECVNLEALTLEGSQGVGEEVLAALRSMPKLRQLHLRYAPFSPVLQKEIFSLSALEEIRLYASHTLDGDDWDALSQLESLISLEVDYWDLPADAADAVGRLARLTALRIGGHWHGERKVVEELVKLRNWTGFEITRCGVIDDNILEQLGKCSRLRWLGLFGSSGFTGEGLRALAEAGELSFFHLTDEVAFADRPAKRLREVHPDLLIHISGRWSR